MAGGGRSGPADLAYVPAGVPRDIRAGGEFGSAQRGFSDEQFSRVQPEFRRRELRKLFKRHATVFDYASRRARSTIQLGGPVLIGTHSRLFFLFGVFRSGVSRRNRDTV